VQLQYISIALENYWTTFLFVIIAIAVRSEIMGIDYGSKFLELRKKNRLSQKDLATIAEVGQTTISEIESGKKSPTAITIEKICKALNMTLAEFFAEERPELEPELRRLMDTARKLSPEQIEYLQKLLEAMSKE